MIQSETEKKTLVIKPHNVAEEEVGENPCQFSSRWRRFDANLLMKLPISGKIFVV